MNGEKVTELKSAAFASIALAFASFGDAFLYAFLPLNASSAGVTVFWIGVLLSINRYVRIFSNGAMVRLFSRYGLRVIMVCAAILAVVSTGGYAVASGIVAWLFFRICWGIAFSAMRIGTIAYSLRSGRPGFALGISRALQEGGPMIVLLCTPFLVNAFDARMIFVLLMVASFPALYFAYKLPRERDRTPPVVRPWISPRLPSLLDSMTFLSAMLIDGMIVVVLGILFLQYHQSISLITATALAAFYLGYRRICLVVLSPAGGWIGDNFGLERAFNISMAMMLGGLLILASGYIALGSVIVFTFYSVNAAITPGAASATRDHSLSAVAENATWRDLGAAMGTLAGGLLTASPHLMNILFIAIFGLMILLCIRWGTARKALKYLYLWR